MDLVDVVAFGDRIYAAAAGPYIFAYDGKAWDKIERPEFAGAAVFKLWGTSADNIVMPISRMNQPISLARYNGRSWGFEDVGPGAGVKIDGADPDDFWLLSPQQPYHHDDKGWQPVPAPRQKLFSLSVGATNRAVAVGEDGVALVWNGTQWLGSPTGTTERLLGAFVAPDGAAWIGGARIYRRSLP